MREVFLLGHLYQSYRHLSLSHFRLAMAFVLMFLTAILEAIGLSILYPLVLAIGSGGRAGNKAFAYLAASLPALEDPRNEMILLLCGVAVLNVAKSAGLYLSYRYNIEFAMY